MVRNDERLIKMIRKEQSGKSGNFEGICDLLFDEINALVRPLCNNSDASSRVTKKILVQLYNKINSVDTSDDIHLWIAGFVAVIMYGDIDGEDRLKYQSGYMEYSSVHIDEDKEFKDAVSRYNDALKDSGKYIYAKDFFEKLTKGQIILFEMFCYAGFTVDEIEKLLEVDSVYISSEVAVIRDKVVGSMAEDKNQKEENQKDDIDAIKAAIQSIVSNTIDEVNTTGDSYNAIVEGVNAFVENDSEESIAPKAVEDTVDDIEVENIKNALRAGLEKNGVGLEDRSNSDDFIEDEFVEEMEGDLLSETQMLDVKEIKNIDKKSKADKNSVNNEDNYDNDVEEDDDVEAEDYEEDYEEKKVLYGKTHSSRASKKGFLNAIPDNVLKILTIAVPSVAVIVFVVILLTSGKSSGNNAANLPDTTTAAATKAVDATTATTKAATTTAAATTTSASSEATVTTASTGNGSNNTSNNNTGSNNSSSNNTNNNTSNNTNNNANNIGNDDTNDVDDNDGGNDNSSNTTPPSQNLPAVTPTEPDTTPSAEPDTTPAEPDTTPPTEATTEATTAATESGNIR